MTSTGFGPMGDDPGMIGSDTERRSERVSERTSERMYVRPLPHEKYHIDRRELDPAFDYNWLPTRIVGAPNPAVKQQYMAGWVPSTNEAFPRLSGYGTQFPARLIELGLIENIRADDPLIVDDMMLVQRPIELSKRAQAQAKADAADKVNNQLQSLQARYRFNFEGGGIKRQIAAVAPMRDE